MTDRQQPKQPDSLVDQAVEAAMDGITAVLKERGARSKHVVILLRAEGVDAGEDDCVTAVQGFMEPDEALREIAAHARAYAQAMGMDLRVGAGELPDATPG